MKTKANKVDQIRGRCVASLEAGARSAHSAVSAGDVFTAGRRAENGLKKILQEAAIEVSATWAASVRADLADGIDDRATSAEIVVYSVNGASIRIKAGSVNCEVPRMRIDKETGGPVPAASKVSPAIAGEMLSGDLAMRTPTKAAGWTVHAVHIDGLGWYRQSEEGYWDSATVSEPEWIARGSDGLFHRADGSTENAEADAEADALAAIETGLALS